MKDDIVVQTATRLGLSPLLIFEYSFLYAEKPHTREYVKYLWRIWDSKGKMPKEVEDMCLDVLAGRVETVDETPLIANLRKMLDKQKEKK